MGSSDWPRAMVTTEAMASAMSRQATYGDRFMTPPG
jgi:hypothetical protein